MDETSLYSSSEDTSQSTIRNVEVVCESYLYVSDCYSLAYDLITWNS